MNQFMEELTSIKQTDELNQSPKQTDFQKLMSYWLVRIIVLLMVVGVPAFISKTILHYVKTNTALSGTLYDLVRFLLAVLMVVLVYFLYKLYCRKIENREAKEFSFPHWFKELFSGSVFGGLIAVLLVGILAIAGMYQIGSVRPPIMILKLLTYFVTGVFVQEVALRLVIFKLLEERVGTWISILIIAVLLSLEFILFEHVNALSTATMFLTDIMLCLAFVLTRRIWFVWGLHVAWYFILSGLFGIPNARMEEIPTYITPHIQGPNWLTGGTIGIEASVINVVLLLIGTVILAKYAIKAKQTVHKLRIKN